MWMSPLSFLGVSVVMFSFLFFVFRTKITSANRIAPDGTPHLAASYLGLFFLPLSYKKRTSGLYGLIHNGAHANSIALDENAASTDHRECHPK